MCIALLQVVLYLRSQKVVFSINVSTCNIHIIELLFIIIYAEVTYDDFWQGRIY